MPSGAKKRKAAKRKKEQQQQQQQQQRLLVGVHQPGSPPSRDAGPPPHSTQGNGVRKEEEEEEDMMSQGSKGSDSGSTSPVGQNNHRLEVEDGDDQAEAVGEENGRIESDSTGVVDIVMAMDSMQNVDTSPMALDNHQCHLEAKDGDEEAEAVGDEKDKVESDSSGVVNIVMVTDSMQNRGKEQPCEPLSPPKTDMDLKKIEEVHAIGDEVRKAEVLLTPPLGPISLSSAEVSISETGAVTVERIQSEKAEDVCALGEGPLPVEHMQWQAIGTANLVEKPVPISEEVEHTKDSLVESCNLATNVAEPPTNGHEESVLHLSDASTVETDQVFKSHHGTRRHEIDGTTEVAQYTQLEQRTSWLSCCGLFDVITGINR